MLLPFRHIPAALPLFLAAPAWAEEAGHASSGEKLAQLDPSFYPSQLLWLLVCFALIYVLMSRVALPKVEKVQGDRARRIAADLAEAQAASERAKAMAAAGEKAVNEARAKAHKAVSELTQKNQAEASARQAQQQQELAARLADADKRIVAARTQAMAHVQDVAIELAQESLRKIAGIEVDAGALRAAMTQARKAA